MHVRHVAQLSVGIDRAVLEYQRDVVVAGGECRALAVDDEQPGETAVDLLAGLGVGMGVIPVGPGVVLDDEVVFVAAAGRDDVGGLAVLVLGHDESVPVNDALVGEPVLEGDLHPLARVHMQCRTEVRAARYHAGGVTVDDLGAE